MIATNDFGIFCVPTKALHRPACQAVLKGRVWEPQTIRFLSENASGDIIHAGTFFGDFLPALSAAYDHVWAFEPNPDSFKCAEVTIRLNDLYDISLTNAALGRDRGTARLCTERQGQYLGGASFIVEEEGSTVIESVDRVIPAEREIGMIHLDVEGYEQATLEGAIETINRWKPVVVVETVPKILPELGYRESKTIENNHVFVLD